MGDVRFCLVAWNCVKAHAYIRMYVCIYIYMYVCIYAQVYIIVGCRSETAGPNSRLPSY